MSFNIGDAVYARLNLYEEFDRPRYVDQHIVVPVGELLVPEGTSGVVIEVYEGSVKVQFAWTSLDGANATYVYVDEAEIELAKLGNGVP